ncbi:MAG: DUF418 domain-containing protein [Phycisphaerales bacterium]
MEPDPSSHAATAPDQAALPALALEPVSLGARVRGVDTLRGVALLGILVMNITAFAYPSIAYLNPDVPALREYAGEFSGANKAAWWIAHTFFDLKMMSIFSMLFGAGLVLMHTRSAGRHTAADAARSGAFARVYYRRIAWLFVIGMIHAYLIWWGDILVAYAICGLVLYPLRRVRARWLIILGAVVTLVAVLISAGFGAALNYLRDSAAESQRILDAGGSLSPDQQGMLDGYRQTMAGINPPAGEIQRVIAHMRGSIAQVLGQNAKEALMLQTIVFIMGTLWRALGMMLLGMGLMKLGVFAAACSTRFYIILTTAGYLVGLPLVHVGGERLAKSNFDFIDLYFVNGHFNYIGSVFVALGHVGAVMLACRVGVLASLRSRLAAVGQMALTNYLMQSVLCVLFFNGYGGLGLGQFARLERAETYLVVAGVWTLELVWSPIWLARFRFGPAEWLWRSLTYWKLQPMRRG